LTWFIHIRPSGHHLLRQSLKPHASGEAAQKTSNVPNPQRLRECTSLIAHIGKKEKSATAWI
jgi:hypothetical protein